MTGAVGPSSRKTVVSSRERLFGYLCPVRNKILNWNIRGEEVMTPWRRGLLFPNDAKSCLATCYSSK